MSLSLDNDGIVESLYHLLWTKDHIVNKGFRIFIPDTVVFKYRRPFAWYFTAMDGTIQRKTEEKLKRSEIKKHFKKRTSDSGIVAYYIHPKYEKTKKQEQFNRINQIKESLFRTFAKSHEAEVAKTKDLRTEIIFEYFDKQGLKEFFKRQNMRDGILQRFIEPSGENNSIIRLIWSPNFCLFERRTNKRRIKEKMFDIYERACTYEGKEFLSKSLPVRSTMITHNLKEIGNKIAQHISNISFSKVRVTRMVLNFKLDKNDRLWILWCGSMRQQNVSLTMSANPSLSQNSRLNNLHNDPLDIGPKISLPTEIRNTVSFSKLKPADLRKNNTCLNCHKKEVAEKMFEIPYRLLIKGTFQREKYGYANDRKIHEEIEVLLPKETKGGTLHTQNKVDIMLKKSWEIPRIIKELHDKMKEVDFYKLSKSQLFLNKTAILCDFCYLTFVEPLTGSGRTSHILPKTYYGIGRLNPEKVSFRRDLTRKAITIMQPDRPRTTANSFLDSSEIHSRLTSPQSRLGKPKKPKKPIEEPKESIEEPKKSIEEEKLQFAKIREALSIDETTTKITKKSRVCNFDGDPRFEEPGRISTTASEINYQLKKAEIKPPGSEEKKKRNYSMEDMQNIKNKMNSNNLKPSLSMKASLHSNSDGIVNFPPSQKPLTYKPTSQNSEKLKKLLQSHSKSSEEEKVDSKKGLKDREGSKQSPRSRKKNLRNIEKNSDLKNLNIFVKGRNKEKKMEGLRLLTHTIQNTFRQSLTHKKAIYITSLKNQAKTTTHAKTQRKIPTANFSNLVSANKIHKPSFVHKFPNHKISTTSLTPSDLSSIHQ